MNPSPHSEKILECGHLLSIASNDSIGREATSLGMLHGAHHKNAGQAFDVIGP
ncbi:MAG: hypothetical protein Q6370_010630 [Candidatus Sigynarchaeota archaeon]